MPKLQMPLLSVSFFMLSIENESKKSQHFYREKRQKMFTEDDFHDYIVNMKKEFSRRVIFIAALMSPYRMWTPRKKMPQYTHKHQNCDILFEWIAHFGCLCAWKKSIKNKNTAFIWFSWAAWNAEGRKEHIEQTKDNI